MRPPEGAGFRRRDARRRSGLRGGRGGDGVSSNDHATGADVGEHAPASAYLFLKSGPQRVHLGAGVAGMGDHHLGLRADAQAVALTQRREVDAARGDVLANVTGRELQRVEGFGVHEQHLIAGVGLGVAVALDADVGDEAEAADVKVLAGAWGQSEPCNVSGA